MHKSVESDQNKSPVRILAGIHGIAPLSTLKQCFIEASRIKKKAFSIHILFTSLCQRVPCVRMIFFLLLQSKEAYLDVFVHAKSERSWICYNNEKICRIHTCDIPANIV